MLNTVFLLLTVILLVLDSPVTGLLTLTVYVPGSKFSYNIAAPLLSAISPLYLFLPTSKVTLVPLGRYFPFLSLNIAEYNCSPP